MPARKQPTKQYKFPHDIELQRIVPLSEGAYLGNTSTDSIRRRHPDKIVRISPRRVGIRIRDALLLNDVA